MAQTGNDWCPCLPQKGRDSEAVAVGEDVEVAEDAAGGQGEETQDEVEPEPEGGRGTAAADETEDRQGQEAAEARELEGQERDVGLPVGSFEHLPEIVQGEQAARRGIEEEVTDPGQEEEDHAEAVPAQQDP